MRQSTLIKAKYSCTAIHLKEDLTGKIILRLSEIALYSVFPNTMAYENTKQWIVISHQFGIKNYISCPHAFLIIHRLDCTYSQNTFR